MEYYCKLPVDIEERIVIVVDPMLATGGSASAATKFYKAKRLQENKADESLLLRLREWPECRRSIRT